MKSKVLFSVLCLFCPAVFSVTFDDGGYHLIDYEINEHVNIDPDTPGAGTHVELVDGGWLSNDDGQINAGSFELYNESKLTVSGGQIDWSIGAHDNSSVNVSDGYLNGWINTSSSRPVTVTGGSMQGISVLDKDAHVDFKNGTVRRAFGLQYGSSATISGGLIEASYSYPNIRLYQDSKLTISGGTIQGLLRSGWYSTDASLITLVGSDFAINGTPVSLGHYASSYSLNGTITGNLMNGGSLDNLYEINGNSDILFVPEPATVLFFSIGGLLLRRRKA